MRATKSIYSIIVLALILATTSILLFGFKSSVSFQEFSQLYGSDKYPGQFEKTIGGYCISLKYRPTQYHVHRISGGNQELSDSLIEINDSIIFFDMKISGGGANSPLFEGDQYLLEERLMYFLNHLSTDLWMSDSRADYHLINHHLERNYNITNSINLQLAFQKPESQQYKFTFNDRMLNIGTINFHIDQEVIDKELPHLKF